ncbi:Amidase 1 [Zostera marina]|uniref:Amidase 1 n=1 Tax=Zostera marina TaxID=29655 RepID=A0A0K9NLL4_ZOSMR|nr:Amidase 1 [Zostera marina]
MDTVKEEIENDYGAFIDKFDLLPPSKESLPPLHGLTFAVKDIFDIAGYVTGFGNPDWFKTHVTATSTSPVVLSTVEAGATCIGKTVMDEMAYSINGENKHYGTPINPSAPDRVPGGSSSGSAVAVSAKLVDFSFGTDTGGSVRVPASYCGIFGIRPSHGVISTSGVIPMAQTFDTVGWFARDPKIMNKVGHVLLPLSPTGIIPPRRVIIPDDCFKKLSFQGDHILKALTPLIIKKLGGYSLQHQNLGDYLSDEVPSLKDFVVQNPGNLQDNSIESLSALSRAMRLLQRFQFKNNHGDWVSTVKPDIGPGIYERVWESISSTNENIDKCLVVRSEIQLALCSLLKDAAILAIPTVPGPPPKLFADVASLESFRAKAFSLLSIAGMSGFCQVTIPLGIYDNYPVSVSLIANHGDDLFLLNFAEILYAAMIEGR